MTELEYEKAANKAAFHIALAIGTAFGGAIAWWLDAINETGLLWVVPLSGVALAIGALLAAVTKGSGS